MQRGIVTKRPSNTDARRKQFGLVEDMTPPTPVEQVSTNLKEIVDKPIVEKEGGVDEAQIADDVAILSDPEIDTDVVEYLTGEWTTEHKQAVWGRLLDEVKERLSFFMPKRPHS